MADKSTSTPSTPWTLPVVLLVTAELSGTIATFMPMKSVFILAADDIPSFFPAWLRATGTVGTALLLVVLAAGFGVLASAATKAIQRFDQANRPKGLPPRANWTPSDRRQFGPLWLTRQQAAKFVLVAVLLVVVTIVSPLFAGLIVAWVGASWIALAYRVHTRPRRAPYPNGQAEFTAVFRKWVDASSLWSSVGGAVITLLVAPPALGITGILLGAIFLQRAQRSTADLSPVLAPPARSANNQVPGGAAPGTQDALSAPFDFLSTPVGNRQLTSSLRQRGLIDVDWRVIGVPSATSLSIMIGPKPDGGYLLLRLFSALHEELLDHEVELRELEGYSGRLGLPATGMAKDTIAGLPAVVFNLGQLDSEWDRPISGDEAVGWQVSWEVETASDESLRSMIDRAPLTDYLELLLPLLARSVGLKGPHQASLSELESRFESLSDTTWGNIATLSLGFAARPADFIRVPHGKIAPLDLSAWKVDALGASWGKPDAYRKAFELTGPKTENIPEQAAALGFIQRHTVILLDQLRGRQLPQSANTARHILKALGELH